MRPQGLLKPGTVFGRDFQVVNRLASGGMGTVYVVEQLSTGKRRALKVLHPQYVTDTRTRERFALEARVGAKIESDHVVEVLAAGVDEETDMPWIAMELLQGQNLAKVASKRAPIPPPEVLEIFRQLCHALGAAHRVGIIHRDLKPENIFLAEARRAGVPFTVKILDFGIAKFVHENTSHLTQAMGSPKWMAPEQSQRGGEICAATDVWALGLIAFNLLTGKFYWKSANTAHPAAMTLLYELITEPIDAPSQRAKDLGFEGTVPDGFDEWFARCVARDIEDRFVDAGEAMEALLPVLSVDPRAAVSLLPPARASDDPEEEVEELDRGKPLPLTHTRGSVRPGGTAAAAIEPVRNATPRPDATPGSGPVPTRSPDRSGRQASLSTSRTSAGTSAVRAPTPAPTPAPSDRAAVDVSRSGPQPSDAFVMGDPTAVPAPSPISDRRAPSSRTPLMVGVGVVAVLGIAGIVLSMTSSGPPPRPPAPETAPPTPPLPPVQPDAGSVTHEATPATPDATAEVVLEDASTAVPTAPVEPGPTGRGGPTRPGRNPGRNARGQDSGAAEPPAENEGIVDQAQVSAVIRGQMSAIRECYERGTRDNPEVGGRLEIIFTINTSGRVSAITTRGLSDAPEVGTCIAGVIRSQSFPAPSAGSAVFTYPVTFTPTRRAPAPTPTPGEDPAPAPAPAPSESPAPAP